MTDEKRARMRMMDKVIHNFGFEQDVTYWFCKLCDECSENEGGNRQVRFAFDQIMAELE